MARRSTAAGLPGGEQGVAGEEEVEDGVFEAFELLEGCAGVGGDCDVGQRLAARGGSRGNHAAAITTQATANLRSCRLLAR